jgi:penicillin G amidase
MSQPAVPTNLFVNILRWVRNGIGLIVILLLFTVAGGLLWWQNLRPEYNGELQLAGLKGKVEVIRDQYGVPHIFAGPADDAWRVLGYIHAQDRFFQMEMQRRAGAGALSEVVGVDALPIDKLFRTLGIYALAEKNFDALAPDAQASLVAYTAGVNAWLESHRGQLPLEFTLLGIKPAVWQPADTLVWGKLMAWRLSSNYRVEAYRGRLAARYDRQKVERLFPRPPGDSPITTQPNFPATAIKLDGVEGTTDVPAPVAPIDLPGVFDALPSLTPQIPPALLPPQIQQAPDLAPPSDDHTELLRRAVPMLDKMLATIPANPPGASNEWVVSGARSTTGKPLLANDPHLELETPILWYLARITSEQGTVMGATVPGLPIVLLGQNNHIAWGFTTTNSDTQDLYLETIDPDDSGSYLTPDGSRKFDVREEVIKVKGADDVKLQVRSTRHGPVMSDIVDELNDDMLAPDQVVALAFTGLSDRDRTAEALMRINQAASWPQFLDALKLYEAPTQNMVFADRAGNIGYINGGLIPVRKNANGRYPADGRSSDGDWVGFVPFDYLPQLYNPAGGAILNANNAVVDSGYRYWLGYDYESHYRSMRIEELLKSKDKFSTDDFGAMQDDNVSLAARQLVPFILRLEPQTQQQKKALALLRNWNFVMDKNRSEPLIFEWWLREMNLRLLAGQLDEVIEARGPLNAQVVYDILQKPDDFCRTWDKRDAVNCDHIIARAFAETLEEMTHRYSPDIDTWRWGNEHVAGMENRVLGHLPGFNTLFGLAFSSDGGFYTLNRGGNYGFGDARKPLIRKSGAGYRAVYDLADPAKSMFMITTGQASHPLSPYYDNLLPLWQDGDYIFLGKSRDDLLRTHSAMLTIMP